MVYCDVLSSKENITHLCSVLVHKVGVLGSAGTPKVLNLHHHWQDCHVKDIL